MQIHVDQQEDPQDGPHNGAMWESLGVYSITSDTVRIELTNLAYSNILVADAIRWEAVPTTTGIDDVEVDEDAEPTAIDVFAAFNDLEDSDSRLAFTVSSNSNPSLFASTVVDYETGSRSRTPRISTSRPSMPPG